MSTDEALLSADELVAVVHRAFGRREDDALLVLLVDLPDERCEDNDAWAQRRRMVAAWADLLDSAHDALGMETVLAVYQNAGSNNGDLPEGAWLASAGSKLPERAVELEKLELSLFEEIFASAQVVIAATELSATAPLKIAAKAHGFRGATMPGFSASMVPALAVDPQAIDLRVRRLVSLLDPAEGARVRIVEKASGRIDELYLDLRERSAHASSGLLHEPGTAGNLPSGEAYIVPYEGEVAGMSSASAGVLPVELDGEVVRYQIEANRAITLEAGGEIAEREAAALVAEPAYGNLAELGLGVLADFGVDAIGAVLLDEKLGLHIAFGRSEHFGGQVGPSDFSDPSKVVHIDRVYVPACQPALSVVSVVLESPAGDVPLIENDRWVVDW